MYKQLHGVLIDDFTGTLLPYKQQVSFPAGMDGYFIVDCKDDSGNQVDFSGGVVTLTIKSTPEDTVAIVSRVATLLADTHYAEIQLAQQDTALVAPSVYVYDVTYLDGYNIRNQIIPQSSFNLTPAVGALNEAVTTFTPSQITLYGIPAPLVASDVLSNNGTSLSWIPQGSGAISLIEENSGTPLPQRNIIN